MEISGWCVNHPVHPLDPRAIAAASQLPMATVNTDHQNSRGSHRESFTWVPFGSPYGVGC